MASTTTDLRLIICEDEYLLAVDMAEQLCALGAEVVAIVANIAELEQRVRNEPRINAAILDVALPDGEVYEVLPILEERDIALVFYSAYLVAQRPARFAHIAWFDKLTPVKDIADALRALRDGWSNGHSN